MTRPADFRTTVRSGRRVGAANTLLHVVVGNGEREPRFGFIVTKAVGGAVTRNLVRRRLRAVCRDILPNVAAGVDVVVRALPGSDRATWGTLHSEIAEALGKAVSKG